MKGGVSAGQRLHPRFISQNGSARDRRARVDRQDGESVALLNDLRAKRFDKR